MMNRIARDERAGRVCRRVGEIAVADSDRGLSVSVAGRRVHVDEVWTATGTRPCVSSAPPLDRLCHMLGAERISGRPVLDSSMRVSGSVVQVMGRLAQLQLGPTAGNLAGARRGAEAVVGAVVGADAMYALTSL
jgi:hypothetical protein